MEFLLPIVIGALYAAGLYMLVRRSVVKLLLGLVLLGHATNLLIFAASGLTRGAPIIAAADEMAPPSSVGDPVPQALVLTAIVIGFGIQAFALVLFKRLHQVIGSADLDEIKTPAA